MSQLAAAIESLAAKEGVMAAKTTFQEGRHKDAVCSLYKVASRGDWRERPK
jgi:hypothetical protein